MATLAGSARWERVKADDEPAMTMHLRLLAEEAEDALQRHASFQRQVEEVALDVTQAEPGPFRRFLNSLALRKNR